MIAKDGSGVCVCIAAYNAEPTIARAIVSALNQAYVTEVIVVDDGSTDATAEVACQCDDGSGRLAVITLEQNGGPALARNRALAMSKAAIFCVLDADDYFMEKRIERLLAANCGDWDFLADDILIVPEQLKCPNIEDFTEDRHWSVALLDLDTFILSNVTDRLKPRAELGFLKPLMRRRFLNDHNLAYDPGLRLGEDYSLYVRALLAGAIFKIVDCCSYVAIERASSLSSQHTAADLAGLQAFDAACVNLVGLSASTRQALEVHHKSTTNKWVLARALEIRRQRGMGASLGFLVQYSQSAGYVAAEVLRAKWGRFLLRVLGKSGVVQSPGQRRLIGKITALG